MICAVFMGMCVNKKVNIQIKIKTYYKCKYVDHEEVNLNTSCQNKLLDETPSKIITQETIVTGIFCLSVIIVGCYLIF